MAYYTKIFSCILTKSWSCPFVTVYFLILLIIVFYVRQSVQAVFRSLASLEKTVEKCHIELEEQRDRLTFTLHCKHGMHASFLLMVNNT